MRVSTKWLRDYISISLAPPRLAERLTLSGFEVEEIIEADGDTLLEVAITPNRGDCLSMIGIAREVSAITNVDFKLSYPKRWREAKKSQGEASVKIAAKEKCSRYCGQLMEGVSIGPSPQWMQDRLEGAGIRAINNVVDATNYVMLEFGQPLHAFDHALLAGGGVEVRAARKGEKIVAIDGKERVLVAEDLVIADQERPIALAGVMGGHESEVSDATRTLFLESAQFDPSTVRRTSKRLGISTDSSYRFERGIDWYGVKPALLRLIELLQEISGAKPVGKMTDLFSKEPPSVHVDLHPTHVHALAGIEWPAGVMKETLQQIGCIAKKKQAGTWEVAIPSHRHDLKEEVDLIEEVVRLRGFQEIIAIPPERHRVAVPANSDHRWQRCCKDHLVALGFSETIHFSFCGEEELRHFGGSWLKQSIELANPLSQEAAYLRPTLLVSLLQSAVYHATRQRPDLRLFELRPAFQRQEGKTQEDWKLAGILMGRSAWAHWGRPAQPADFYEAKGVVESLLASLTIPEIRWEGLEEKSAYRTSFHPGKAATVWSGERRLGVVGEIHPGLADTLDLKESPSLFELDWGMLQDRPEGSVRFRPYSVYPYVSRDLAVVVSEEVSAASITALIEAQDGELIHSIEVFDLYRGEQIPAGKKSLAFNIRMGLMDRTLTDEEVDGLHQKIIQSLRKELQAEVR